MTGATDRKFSTVGIVHVALGAVILLGLTGIVQQYAQAQSASATVAPRPQGQNPNGMHIYIWAGLKSHLPGQHDYPQLLADWSKILRSMEPLSMARCIRRVAPISNIPTSS